MLLSAVGLLLGLILLLIGADRMVDAAAELALYYGLSPFFYRCHNRLCWHLDSGNDDIIVWCPLRSR